MRFLLVLIILVILGAGAFLFGGFYNVAATAPDPAFVVSALERIRAASIDRHATEQPPATLALDSPAVVQDGARAFATRGCINCHGGPGANWAKFSEGLSPGPPDLKDVAPTMEPRELFWVIKNGINMTGMPSFGGIDVPDREIWTIVAFVKKLPSVSDADFKTWTSAAPAATAAPAAPAPAKAP